MKCNGRFIKIFAIFVIGLAVINLSLTGMNNTVGFSEIQPGIPAVYHISSIGGASDPLAYLFQILFILFIISPPLIVLLLFLIWKELRDRNKMK